MERIKDFALKALHIARLAVWVLEKVIDAIETFPKNSGDRRPGGGGAAVPDKEKQSGDPK